MVTEPPSKFNVSDELFFKIFPIYSLIIFGSMIFFSISYRQKKVANNKIDDLVDIKSLINYPFPRPLNNSFKKILIFSDILFKFYLFLMGINLDNPNPF